MSGDRTQADRDVLLEIVREIVSMEGRGDMRAIGTVIVDRDGDVRTLIAYAEGEKLKLLGGAFVLQRDLSEAVQRTQKERRD